MLSVISTFKSMSLDRNVFSDLLMVDYTVTKCLWLPTDQTSNDNKNPTQYTIKHRESTKYPDVQYNFNTLTQKHTTYKQSQGQFKDSPLRDSGNQYLIWI